MTPHIPNTTRSSARLLCVCKNCGKEFHEYRSRIALGRGVNCSRKCADEISHPKRPIEERFWEKVDKSNGDGACWLWMAATVESGYGAFHYRKDAKDLQRGSHIFAWELTHGPIADDMWVLHKCDNPPCVNPNHLFLGDVYDNNADMYAKGRYARGETNGRSKLSEEQARIILDTYVPRVGMVKQFAGQFGVTEGAISAILFGRNWRHLK